MTLSNQIAQSSKQAEEEAQIRHVINNLEAINRKLGEADPSEIIEWAIDHLPGLYQTTAFGITGCITVDMISRISEQRAAKAGRPAKHLVPLIFVDTLYHFPQTLELAHKAAKHYSAEMHVYTPPGTTTVREFEDKWGPQLWERDEDTYDYLVKVEPARRSYDELGVRAVFTGRRRSQGADRASLKAVEVDETGLVKVNALMNWSFGQVDAYAKANAVPYNELLDLGYKSIGDWHSTALPGAGDSGERAGRWKDKAGKTECGLHKDYFKMKNLAEKKLREAELARKDEAKDKATAAAAEAQSATPAAVA
ncbi:probable MET16-3`-phosphoadenylylsulfate reductase [Sporisorium reilianum SRZ2]|uniref:Probable MET16-3`-phosphoadenylylsulfate reductase n=2 Tax=Sporisorium reilianum TaxID=72558 RepID=E7A1I3_SPORE|nr:probable MET16-3`-phosphoadenylylsulfate reductase [Sporisorium reilianum SRZ2]SJX63175.1 probable MET16-3`-phosphoadenylylsulfate reductase [Sporisorium reilianum f. sp. reilianum]